MRSGNFRKQIQPFGIITTTKPAKSVGGSEPQVQAGSEKHIVNPAMPQTALRIYASGSLKIPENVAGKENMIDNIYLEPTVKPPVPGTAMDKFFNWLKTGKTA